MGGGYSTLKNKGFTLIELLAVIVILAIIALIATPIVLNLINKAREGAAKASATSYIKAVETYMITSELDGSSKKLEKGQTYEISEIDNLIELKGTRPSSGDITIDDKRNVSSATLVVDGYSIIYDGNSYEIEGKAKNVEVQSITLDRTDARVGKGGTLQLTATVEPANATDKTVTWESSNSDKASVDGTGLVTGIEEGTTVITAKTKNGKSITANITVNAYLADKVQVGEYVAYDAGKWEENKEKPIEQEKFGGYTQGKNRGESVSCFEETAPTLKGWRVLEIDQNTKTVTIVHAGVPECYFHNGSSEYQIPSVNALKSRASVYMNDYAESAHALDYNEAKAITKDENTTENDLRTTGTKYYLATPYSDYGLWSVDSNGSMPSKGGNPYGFRPVVELKSNVLTSGQGKDMFDQKAWTLVAQD